LKFVVLTAKKLDFLGLWIMKLLTCINYC